MANLTSSGVTVVDNYEEGGSNGKRFSVFELTLVLSSMGTTTNKIQASVLGLTTIVRSTPAVDSNNAAVYPTAPSYDGTLLLIGGGSSNAPQDISATVHVTVFGY